MAMNVEFHLYFPEEAKARAAAEALKAEDYEVEARPSADGVEWIVLASGSVGEKDFEALEARVESFARSHGGRFDGYEEDA
jgi:hypothetical protein